MLLPLKFEIRGGNAWRESLHKCCTAIEAADFDRGGLSADLLSDFEKMFPSYLEVEKTGS